MMRLIPLTLLSLTLFSSVAALSQASAADPTSAGIPPNNSSKPDVHPSPDQAEQSPSKTSLFDPQKHWRVSQVQPGWKGYGLSVFHGTSIERFDVEVISILHNFNPRGDVILIRCSGQNLEHTGPIAGMSGSPIYLTDPQGNTRLAGAFAYGWSLMKDPLAGVQPIEYMLDMQPQPPAEKQNNTTADHTATHPSMTNPSAAGSSVGATPSTSFTWRMDDTYWNPAKADPARLFAPKSPGNLASVQSDDRPMALQPLSTPLSCAGLPQQVMDTFAPLLRAKGLTTLQSGGGQDDNGAADIALEPGSVIAVPLLIGDVDMTAVGTVTEVLGDRVFGFGHPFMSEGPVNLPMANGQVQGIVASLMTSFKLGSMGQVRGTLTNDQTFGIAGTIGPAPAMIPIDIHVVYTNGSEDRTYHFMAASHREFTSTLASIALMTAATGQRSLPPNHTIDYDLTINFENGRQVHLRNTVSDADSYFLFYELGMPIAIAANNPFDQVLPTSLKGEMRISPHSSYAEMTSIILPKNIYQPGETMRAFVVYRPFRGDEITMPVTFELPRDLPDGEYRLSIADWDSYLDDEAHSKPFRFVAQSADELFTVLDDVLGVQQKALYVYLTGGREGIAQGRKAMVHLPSSRQQIMLSSGRSDVSLFDSTQVKIIPTQYIMHGHSDFGFTVERKLKMMPAQLPDRPDTPDKLPAEPPHADESPTAKPNKDQDAPGESGQPDKNKNQSMN